MADLKEIAQKILELYAMVELNEKQAERSTEYIIFLAARLGVDISSRDYVTIVQGIDDKLNALGFPAIQEKK